MSGKRIGIVEGQDAKNWLPNVAYQSAHTYKTRDDVFNAVLDGEIDAEVDEYRGYTQANNANKDKVDSVVIEPFGSRMAS